MKTKLKHDVPALLKRIDDAGIEVTDAYSERSLHQTYHVVTLVAPKRTAQVAADICRIVYKFSQEFPSSKIVTHLVGVVSEPREILRIARARGREVLGVKLRRLDQYEFGSLRFYRLLGVSIRIRNEAEFRDAERRLLAMRDAHADDPEFLELAEAVEAYDRKHHTVAPPTEEEAARFRAEQEAK
jgi:hypothetical protein